MGLVRQFEEYVSNNKLITKQDHLLLAVSGGLDSVVLCELCKQAGYNFEIAHCNFQLRGKESERDQEFVQSLAAKYRVSFHLKVFDTATYSAEKKLSIQEAARELRYNWFEELIKDRQPSVIITAHHADDNIETMLMHFFRGTGIHGLRGMLPKQGKVVRPLLFAKKEDLKKFAEINNLRWVEDSSNSSDKYTRNYFRHQVIPLVQKIFPAAEENLLNNLERFAGIETLYNRSILTLKRKLLVPKGEEFHIPVLKLKNTEPVHTLVYEIIKDFGFTSAQVKEVISLFESESGRYIQSSTHRIIKNRNWLIITPLWPIASQNILIEEEQSNLQFALGSLKLGTIPVGQNHTLVPGPNIASLDKQEIKFPLLLRKWKQGDYFYPLGMKKKKKLSRFFIDQKLSISSKEKVWVLEMNKKIIWVVGMRIDDRFKVSEKTREILKIDLSPIK